MSRVAQSVQPPKLDNMKRGSSAKELADRITPKVKEFFGKTGIFREMENY